MFTDIRIKFNSFIRKHRWKLVLILVGWSILVAVSTILNNIKINVPITTYKPYEPIIDNGQTMPSKWQNVIKETIDKYIEYCNNKEYEKAYEMIGENARKQIYPKLEDFKAYVDYVFGQKRVYAIQNYSNRDNIYIFRIRIFEDIMATGLTYSESFKYFEEKLTFVENNGKLIMGVKGYIDDQVIDDFYEDQYIQVAITKKNVTYDNETYTVEIKNKTDYELVIKDDIETEEVQLETEDDIISEDMEGAFMPIHIAPHSSSMCYFKFVKFYDEGIKSTGLRLNSIRILRSYSSDKSMKEQELQNAVQLYSITIPLK